MPMVLPKKLSLKRPAAPWRERMLVGGQPALLRGRASIELTAMPLPSSWSSTVIWSRFLNDRCTSPVSTPAGAGAFEEADGGVPEQYRAEERAAVGRQNRARDRRRESAAARRRRRR